MTMKFSTLKPGYLVSLKTTIKGGVSYQKIDLEMEHRTEGGALESRWETTRRVEDAEEFAQATKARSAARSVIVRQCIASSFGLLCPASNVGALEAALADAREIAERHNALATCTRVDVYALIGRIAQDEAEATRALAAEMGELMAAMKAGIAAADPQAIREAANKAVQLGKVLEEGTAKKVSEAIAQARSAARRLVRDVEKAGEDAATVVAEINTAALDRARFEFLDIETQANAAQAQATPAAPPELEMDEGEPGEPVVPFVEGFPKPETREIEVL